MQLLCCIRMSRVHTLTSIQKIPSGLEETWSFFSNPANLLTITPPFLNLKVTNEVFGKEAYAGQVLTYMVKPLLGIPFSWMTEIRHVEERRFFVDEQRKGPYRLWHHQHHFKPIDGGVEMIDLVHYRLPFGLIGELAHFAVKKKLHRIFDYRYKKINELFGQWSGEEMNLKID
jgi:ligand-binding SRPBCC domain-containing protein